MQREYHEIYGFLPADVVNQIPVRERQKLFLEWLDKGPTQSGWFIVNVVVSALGEPFAEYMFNCILESIVNAEQEVSKETVQECLEDLLTHFATDVNTLHQFIDNYLEETGNELKFDFSIPGQTANQDQDMSDQDQDMENPVKDEYYRDAKGRLRDSKGHFVKDSLKSV